MDRTAKKIQSLLLAVGLALMVTAAGAQTFYEVDSATYRNYVDGNWKELIRTGKMGLKKDFDYYYLRLRMGIACYEGKNYKSAQVHFIKALEFSENDPLASEYLYYAYLFSGQKQQAAMLYKDLSSSLQEKIQAPTLRIVDGISAEYLYNKTFTDDMVKDPATFEGLPTGARVITRDYHNLNVGLQHNMHPGTSFTHAYTYLGKSNYYYYDDGFNRFGVDGQKVNQHQYYLSPSFTTSRGLVISPSFHFLYIGYQVPDLSAGGPGPGGGSNVAFTEESETQLLGGISIFKYQGSLSFGLGTVYSNLNSANQFTGSGSLTWYPYGNLNMYLGASLYVHMADLNDGAPVLIPDAILGYGIASKVWLEISGTYGEMQNFAQSNGYIVFNGLDWMKYKIMGNIILPVGKKGSLIYAGARYSRYENRYISFAVAEPENQYLLTYNSLSIFGGISWKF